MLDFKISKKGLDNGSFKKYYTVCSSVPMCIFIHSGSIVEGLSAIKNALIKKCYSLPRIFKGKFMAGIYNLLSCDWAFFPFFMVKNHFQELKFLLDSVENRVCVLMCQHFIVYRGG